MSDVLADIASVKAVITDLKAGGGNAASMDPWSYHSAKSWYEKGMDSVFLQDANTLFVDPDDLTQILSAVRENFPDVSRITSYARSQTIAALSAKDLKRLKEAGLNRIHIGMESGSDLILTRIKKGADQATHIKAGLKVKQAGIELSEYIMPGLGGVEHSCEHAIQTAYALNQIDPDFIRIRTLALPDQTGLASELRSGLFTQASDVLLARELKLLISSLHGIGSTVISDHILNLLPEIEGTLPKDQQYMLAVLDHFLNLDQVEQTIYIIGRRIGVMGGLYDLNSETRRRHAIEFIVQNKVTPETSPFYAAELMKRFI